MLSFRRITSNVTRSGRWSAMLLPLSRTLVFSLLSRRATRSHSIPLTFSGVAEPSISLVQPAVHRPLLVWYRHSLRTWLRLLAGWLRLPLELGPIRPLTLILDEAANYPLPSLGSLMSEGGGTSITTMVVLQSLAQARDRWGSETAGADSPLLRLTYLRWA